MNYVEEVLADIKTLESARIPRETFLQIRSDVDISSEALRKAESISFPYNYEGPSLGSLLPIVVNSAPKLRELSVHLCDYTIDFSALDLRRVEKLTVYADSDNSFVAVDMPKLIDLSVRFNRDSASPSFLDLSGAPNIKSLALYDTNSLDFSCLNTLMALKKLHIRSQDMMDLDWLKDTGYKLKTLYVEGKINDCEGIISQHELERLSISHHVLLDVSPIEKLKHLKDLDLLYGTLLGEGNLRAMGLEHIRLNKRDEDYRAIRAKVRELCFLAARTISYENRVGQGLIIPQNPYFPKLMKRRMEKPLDLRIEECITRDYDAAIESMKNDKRFHAHTMNRSEYIEAYKMVALNEYPFLQHRH